MLSSQTETTYLTKSFYSHPAWSSTIYLPYFSKATNLVRIRCQKLGGKTNENRQNRRAEYKFLKIADWYQPSEAVFLSQN